MYEGKSSEKESFGRKSFKGVGKPPLSSMLSAAILGRLPKMGRRDSSSEKAKRKEYKRKIKAAMMADTSRQADA